MHKKLYHNNSEKKIINEDDKEISKERYKYFQKKDRKLLII